jgi:hypothetical protein
MSDLLAKLKVKPIPKKIEEINVNIPVPTKQEEVVIRTEIIDKRDESTINREYLLNRIKKNIKFQGVKNKYSITTTIAEEKEEAEETEQGAKEEKGIGIEEKTIEVPPPPPQEKTEVKTKAKTRKIKSKVKLMLEEEPKISGEIEIPPQPQPQVVEREGEGEEKEEKEEEEMIIKVKKRRTVKPGKVVREGPFTDVVIGDTILSERLPLIKPKIVLRASNYYMNNRKIFTNFISSLFMPYKKQFKNDKKTFSCESKTSEEFELLTHQSLVRDYINLYSPYRGLLLYHGLGSGKTCTSIAIAEGLKSDKQIYILTPASLRMNYIESLKKCGDPIYKKNQFWEFINTRSNENPDLINTLSQVLNLSVDYIRSKGGAWLVNVKTSKL